MGNPFVNQVVSAVHSGEQEVGEFGAIAQDVLQVAAGHTSIPLHFRNGTNRPIWVAVHADFIEPSSAFQSASIRAWFEIRLGQVVNVGNIFTGGFSYSANNDQGEIWSGPIFFGNFVDGGGVENVDKRFINKELPNNWLTFSSFTLTFTQ